MSVAYVFDFDCRYQPTGISPTGMHNKATFPKGNKKYRHPPTSAWQNMTINCLAISRLCAKRSACRRTFSSARPAAARRSAVWRKSVPPWRLRRKARRWSCSRPNRPPFNSNASCSPADTLPGYTRLHIFSFERLARFVLDALAVPPPSGLLTEEGRVMVLRALLLRHEGELKLFRHSARRPGFARQVSQLLGELQQHQFTPARLRALSRQTRLAPRTAAQTPRPRAVAGSLCALAHGTRIAGRQLPA